MENVNQNSGDSSVPYHETQPLPKRKKLHERSATASSIMVPAYTQIDIKTDRQTDR